MNRFKMGDEVILAREHPTQGSVGITSSDFGKRYRISHIIHAKAYYIDMLRCPIQYSVFEEMLDPAPPRRTAGTPYRAVGPGWTEQLFADPTVSAPQVASDLLDQLGEHLGEHDNGRPVVSDMDVNGNVIVADDIVFLRL